MSGERLGWPRVAGSSDPGDGFHRAFSDSLLESGVVPFVLVGVGLGELGDRSVECVSGAEVRGEGDAVTGAGGFRTTTGCDYCFRTALRSSQGPGTNILICRTARGTRDHAALVGCG